MCVCVCVGWGVRGWGHSHADYSVIMENDLIKETFAVCLVEYFSSQGLAGGVDE